MSKEITTISGLKEELRSDIIKAFEGKATDHIHTQMNMAIKSEVYSYQPRRYDRRGRLDGGLQDRDSTVGVAYRKGGNGVRLEVENRAKANRNNPEYHPILGSSSQYLTPLIVYGHGGAGGSYSYGDEFPMGYTRPRDFISETRRLIKKDNMQRVFLMIGLEDMGYQVRTY